MTQALDGSVNHFEIYTMTDKARRDEMYRVFRASDDPQERQAVKFSGIKQVFEYELEGDGKKVLSSKWVTTYSVGYPSGRG